MSEPTLKQGETFGPDRTPSLPESGTDRPHSDSTPPSSGPEPRNEDSTPKGGGAGAEAAPALCPTIPGYEILQVLGHGGMGVVYKAREIALNRLVALKIVVAGVHASREQLLRFRAEAHAEARLQHPNIVQIHAVGEHEGFPYLSLEYLDGGSLAQKIARQPQPPGEAARLIQALARAMAFAHGHGIIHRDLKPANILLTSGAAPKIADFGLAKHLEDASGPTRTGSLLGTPTYMAPEQAEGHGSHVGPGVDIWALGVILYEMLVGRPPFQGVTMVDTLEQVKTREPVPPTQLQPKVPADLETICLKCLRKEPEQRYATAEALAEDLRRFLAGEPILARPVGALERCARWCRRNPRLAALSAAVLFLLLTVAVTSTVFALVLDARQRETEIARTRADESARTARDRYQLALDALRVVIDKVQKDLKAVPAATQARRDILEAAMTVLRESVARQDPSGLPERGLASAHMMMGDILWEQDKRAEAVEHYNQCHAILEALYRAAPDSDKAAGNFSASLGKQGDLALDWRNDAAEAKSLYQRALHIQQELLDHPPAERELRPDEVRRITANSHQRLGEIVLRSDPENLAEAEEHFRTARELLEAVVRDEGSTPNYQKLAEVSFKLGTVNEKMNRPEEALRAYDRCMAMRKKLVEANPGNLRCKLDLFDLCGKVGDQALFRGDTPSARRYYREAIVPNEELARTDKQPGVRKLLGLNYYRLATACLRLGESGASVEYFRKCLDVRAQLQKEIPNNVGLQIDLMLAQARCGRHAEAAAFAEKLRQNYPKNTNYLLQAACGYALSAPGVGADKSPAALTVEEQSRRQRYLDRAVEVLRQAKVNGYKDVKNLEVEPDLDPVRDHPGFLALMREYGARAPEPRK
jgi:tetratricopeptide (TPR) repeat protein